MSRVIVSDSFAGAVNPSPSEVEAFHDTLSVLNSAMSRFAVYFIDSVKSQPEANAMRANLDQLEFGFGNWWKHVICEHAEHTLQHTFGEHASGHSVEMLDCRVDGEAMIIKLKLDGVEQDEVVQIDHDMVMLNAYEDVTAQDGFRKLKSLCSQIGGLNLTVALNQQQPENGRLVTPPKTAVIYVNTVDGVPLSEKVQRFEEFGPMH